MVNAMPPVGVPPPDPFGPATETLRQAAENLGRLIQERNEGHERISTTFTERVRERITTAAESFNEAMGALATKLANFSSDTVRGRAAIMTAKIGLEKLSTALLHKNSNTDLYILTTGPKPPIANKEQVEAYNPVFNSITTALNRISRLTESFKEHELPLDSILPAPRSVEEKDWELSESISKKVFAMSCITLINKSLLGKAALSFEEIKGFLRGKDSVKSYFQTLNWPQRLWANLLFFFLKPSLQNILMGSGPKKAGVITQVISALRKRLGDSEFRKTFVSSLVSDIAHFCEKGRNIKEEYAKGHVGTISYADYEREEFTKEKLDQDAGIPGQLNEFIVSELKKHLTIHTGYPIIGPLLDKWIRNRIIGFVQEMKLPALAKNFYTLSHDKLDISTFLNPTHPAIFKIVESLKDLTGRWVNDIQIAQDKQLSEIKNHTKKYIDIPEPEQPPALVNEKGGSLSFDTIIRTVIAYLTIENAPTEDKETLRETLKKSNFQIHLDQAGRNKEVLEDQVRTFNYFITNVVNWLQPLGPIEGVIESQVQAQLATVVQNGIRDLFKLLDEESTRDALLEKLISFSQELITVPDLSPAQIAERTTLYRQNYESLEKNIQSIIRKVTDFEFRSDVQKERHEQGSNFRLQWISSLKRTLSTVSFDISPLVSEAPQNPEEFLRVQKHYRKMALTVESLLQECSSRLKEIEIKKGQEIPSDFTAEEWLFFIKEINQVTSISRQLTDALEPLLETAPQLGETLSLKAALEESLPSITQLEAEEGSPFDAWYERFRNTLIQPPFQSWREWLAAFDEHLANKYPDLTTRPSYQAIRSSRSLQKALQEDPQFLEKLSNDLSALPSTRRALSNLGGFSEPLSLTVWYSDLKQSLHGVPGSQSLQKSLASLESTYLLTPQGLIEQTVLSLHSVHNNPGDEKAMAHAHFLMNKVIQREFLPYHTIKYIPQNIPHLINLLEKKKAEYPIDRAFLTSNKILIEKFLQEARGFIAEQEQKQMRANERISVLSAELSALLTKHRPYWERPGTEAKEILEEEVQSYLKPLIDSYLSFLGSRFQEYISTPFNLRLLTIRQLNRLRPAAEPGSEENA